MELGVILSRSDVLVTEPLPQLPDTESLRGVVQGTCNRGSGTVSRDLAHRIPKWNVGFPAQQRNDVPVDVLRRDPDAAKRKEEIDNLVGLGVQTCRLCGAYALPSLDSLADDRLTFMLT